MEETTLLKLDKVDICREENVILHRASFTLHNGEFVYVIGKVGSGKSSLLKSLYCEIPINQGDAWLLDYNLCKMRRKDIPYLRRKLGIVFQDFQLLTDRSVHKNLEFVLKATGWKKKSGNLDPETSGQIVQLLHDICRKGTAVIMTTHNYTLVHNYPARIVKCENACLSDVGE